MWIHLDPFGHLDVHPEVPRSFLGQKDADWSKWRTELKEPEAHSACAVLF